MLVSAGISQHARVRERVRDIRVYWQTQLALSRVCVRVALPAAGQSASPLCRRNGLWWRRRGRARRGLWNPRRAANPGRAAGASIRTGGSSLGSQGTWWEDAVSSAHRMAAQPLHPAAYRRRRRALAARCRCRLSRPWHERSVGISGGSVRACRRGGSAWRCRRPTPVQPFEQ